jgi:hypothetical protein
VRKTLPCILASGLSHSHSLATTPSKSLPPLSSLPIQIISLRPSHKNPFLGGSSYVQGWVLHTHCLPKGTSNQKSADKQIAKCSTNNLHIQPMHLYNTFVDVSQKQWLITIVHSSLRARSHTSKEDYMWACMGQHLHLSTAISKHMGKCTKPLPEFLSMLLYGLQPPAAIIHPDKGMLP